MKNASLKKANVFSLDVHSGAHYFEPGVTAIKSALPSDPYYYQTFVGSHKIAIEVGDSAFWISVDKNTAYLSRGPCVIESTHFTTVVRGYAPDDRSCVMGSHTNLPYINGCSTKQIFAPERPGDPTLQMLIIPPHASEQAHHIHSTVRAVYVLSGEGVSVVGMDKETVATTLRPGMVCVLERMCPHHFETSGSGLLVLPMHVWSSIPGVENNHPMFNGTFRT